MANIWIIGAGGIAIEYTKVLKALDKEFITIGRGHKSAMAYYEATGVKARWQKKGKQAKTLGKNIGDI